MLHSLIEVALSLRKVGVRWFVTCEVINIFEKQLVTLLHSFSLTYPYQKKSLMAALDMVLLSCQAVVSRITQQFILKLLCMISQL